MADQIKKAMTNAGVKGNARRRIRRAYNKAEEEMVEKLAEILETDVELVDDSTLRIGENTYDEVEFSRYVNHLPLAKQKLINDAMRAYVAAMNKTFRKNVQ